MAGAATPGQSLWQYSQLPATWLPEVSTWVEHQGVASPSIVVQVLWIRLPNLNGKTQFPQFPVEGGGGGGGEGVVDPVVVDVVVLETGLGDGVGGFPDAAGQVFMFGSWESIQFLK